MAVRAGMPAARAAEQRTAHAAGAAMHAGAAALRHTNLVGRGLVDRSDRHRLGGHAHQAKADGKHGCSKQFH